MAQDGGARRRLGRDFFRREVLDVAPALLGATVVHGPVAVRLTEVEAYAGERDPGSHAFRGRTARTAVMFGPAGHLYVYFSYGMHWCANVVTGPDGEAMAVLLRAGEVVGGHETVATRRPGIPERDWARGPARLTATLGISGRLTGADLCSPDAPVRLYEAATPVERAGVGVSGRVGVSGDGGDPQAYPWRFFLEGDRSVSPYRLGKPRRRARSA